MRVILCRRKASQPWELPGKNPRAEKMGVSLTGGAGKASLWAAPSPNQARGGGGGCSRLRGNETHRTSSQSHVLCWWPGRQPLRPPVSEPRAQDGPAVQHSAPQVTDGVRASPLSTPQIKPVLHRTGAVAQPVRWCSRGDGTREGRAHTGSHGPCPPHKQVTDKEEGGPQRGHGLCLGSSHTRSPRQARRQRFQLSTGPLRPSVWREKGRTTRPGLRLRLPLTIL